MLLNGKSETKFLLSFNIYKIKQIFNTYYIERKLTNYSYRTLCNTPKQLKDRKVFFEHHRKTFYHLLANDFLDLFFCLFAYLSFVFVSLYSLFLLFSFWYVFLFWKILTTLNRFKVVFSDVSVLETWLEVFLWYNLIMVEREQGI